MLGTLDERFPLLEITADMLVSKMGDVTVALEVEKPEIFTLGAEDYEALHETFVKALRVLPEGTVVHFQDVYLRTGTRQRHCRRMRRICRRQANSSLRDGNLCGIRAGSF